MEDFDYRSPFYIPSSLAEERGKTLYDEITEAMQLLGVDGNSRDSESYEALQVQFILCSESSSLSSSSCSIGSMSLSLATSTSSRPSSSSTQSLSPLQPLLEASPLFLPSPLSVSLPSSHLQSVDSSDVALKSPTSTTPRFSNSFSCDLCLEKFVKDFLQEASPCGHLFCQFCLFILEDDSSSSSKDISCIVEDCKGYLAPMNTKSSKVFVCCPFCKSLQLPMRGLLEDNVVLPSPNMTETGYGMRCQCCYCLKLF